MPRKPSRSTALAVVPVRHAPKAIPPRDRVLSFGGAWDYTPAPESVPV